MVALSSISEGMPYTVIEAMMCGRPTVSTDVGGVAETVGEAGLVVPPGDPGAFAAACVELLRDPIRRTALGAAARQRALAHFTTGQMLPAYRELYADVHAQDPIGFSPVDVTVNLHGSGRHPLISPRSSDHSAAREVVAR